jgi:hypothetical protein
MNIYFNLKSPDALASNPGVRWSFKISKTEIDFSEVLDDMCLYKSVSSTFKTRLIILCTHLL